jgi:hypothetical protein
MSDNNSANKFIKIIVEGFPKATYKAVLYDGRTFKSKGYEHAKMEFESTKSKRLRGETEGS